MIEFAWPWLLFALPLPWLIRRFAPPAETSQARLQVPDVQAFRAVSTTTAIGRNQRLTLILASLIWGLLVLAAMRPEWLGEPVRLPVVGRDLLLAVDLSGSMREQDMAVGNQYVTRLAATQAIAGEFIRRRTGDRIGLILFGAEAYLQTPLTFDRETTATLLHEAVIGLAGRETAIGDAIGLAVKRLQRSEIEHKVLILLTDGANTAGSIEPLKAAELAAAAGLKIYTIGVGAEALRIRSFFGTQLVNPSADLDESSLRSIAEQTGGRYFRARDAKELEKIYALLDELEPVARDQQQFRPLRALFYWPLGTAAILSLCLAAISLRSHGGWRPAWSR